VEVDQTWKRKLELLMRKWIGDGMERKLLMRRKNSAGLVDR